MTCVGLLLLVLRYCEMADVNRHNSKLKTGHYDNEGHGALRNTSFYGNQESGQDIGQSIYVVRNLNRRLLSTNTTVKMSNPLIIDFFKETVHRNQNQTSVGLVSKNNHGITTQDSSFLNRSQEAKTISGHLTANKSKSQKRLYVGGLFELSDTVLAQEGHAQLMAAELAIRHINERKYLPGYMLHMFHNDTKCNPGVGADVFYDMVYRKPQMIAVVGSACSDVIKTVGQVVPYWNLLLVSHGATSPALSWRGGSKTIYSTFRRLATIDSSHNEARRAFIQNFNWNTVATITQDKENFVLAMNDMYKVFDNGTIRLKITQTFRNTEDLTGHLLKLSESDARIIIGSFDEDMATHVFCQAYHMRLTGEKHVWILAGGYRKRWWERSAYTNCTTEQLAEAINLSFDVDALSELTGNETSFSGLTNPEFWQEYFAFTNTTRIRPYVTETYDTMWTLAMTIKTTMKVLSDEKEKKSNDTIVSVDDFNYNNGRGLKNFMYETMGRLKLIGMSGPISFRGTDRQGITAFHQLQNGSRKLVGLFSQSSSQLNLSCVNCVNIVWKGSKLPVDKTREIYTNIVVDRAAFGVMSGFCIAGVFLGIGFLAFNIHHRRLKYIKLSSPKLNNVAVCGCITVYVAVILLGFDDRLLVVDHYTYVCSMRAFLFASGFTLSFGSMFVKTFRVHHLFTGRTTGLVRRTMLKDRRLLAIVGCLLILDSAIVLVWILADPMYRETRNVTRQDSQDTDVVRIPQISKCHSIHQEKFMGVLYAYKGLLLIFGTYMAWTTRHVKITALNDSKYIALNVYNVVIMSVLAVALSTILSDQPTLEFVLVASLLTVSTTVMLCLLFVPKLHRIVFRREDCSQVITASGLRVESRTRRLTVDMRAEHRELHYRRDVQNKVYKREILELEKEEYQLERMLELSVYTGEFRDVMQAYFDKECRNDKRSKLNSRKISFESSASITYSVADLTEGTIATTFDEDSGFNSEKSGQTLLTVGTYGLSRSVSRIFHASMEHKSSIPSCHSVPDDLSDESTHVGGIAKTGTDRHELRVELGEKYMKHPSDKRLSNPNKNTRGTPLTTTDRHRSTTTVAPETFNIKRTVGESHGSTTTVGPETFNIKQTVNESHGSTTTAGPETFNIKQTVSESHGSTTTGGPETFNIEQRVTADSSSPDKRNIKRKVRLKELTDELGRISQRIKVIENDHGQP